jgi:hypothetical protein
MIRNLLIKISTDPRKSPRAAEAVRIGAGVGAWNKVKVHLLLEGPAVLCLDEFADELKQGELFTQYLPGILSHGGRILVDENSPSLNSIKPGMNFEKVPAAEISQFVKSVDHVMEF